MINRRAALKAFIAPFVLPPLAAAARVAPPPITETFDEIWRATAEKFYDAKMHGVDWKAVGERYRPLAAQATTRLEFQAVVNHMLEELKASHTGYYTDDDFECHLLRSMFAPGRSPTV